MQRSTFLQICLFASIGMALLVGCSSGNPVSTQVNAGTESSSSVQDIPMPADIAKQVNVVPGERFSYAAEFMPGFTNRVIPGEGTALFDPNYDPDGDGSQFLAWAIYSFNLPGYDVPADLLLGGLTFVGDSDNLWVGLGNFPANKWDWQIYDPETLPGLNIPGDHISPEGQILIAVIMMGDQSAGLSWLRIGGPVTPVADLQADLTEGNAPLEVNFDASSSYARGSDITNYEWDFDGDGLFSETDNGEDLAQGSALSAFTYIDSGTFNPAVRVTDSDGMIDSATIAITVSSLITISGRAELEDETGIEGIQIIISGDADETVLTDLTGAWSTTLLAGSYRATPLDPAWLFLPGFTEFEVTDSNVVLDPFIGTDGWVHTWGGSEEDKSDSVEIDPAGFIYTAGRTYTFGAGGRDVLVQKYDFLGNMLWSKTWGGTESELAYGTDLDSDGNFYVVGYTTSFGAGGYDMFILRYLPDGTLDWQQTWGNVALQEAFDIKALDNGGFLVCGRLSNKTALISFDSDGQAEWGQLYWGNGSSFNYVRGMAIDDLGNIYMAGDTYYSPGTNYNSLVLKYDSTGALLWAREWDKGTNDFLYGAELDTLGNVIAGGNCNAGNGAQDALILKYSPDGDLVWEKVWGTGAFEHIYSMAQQGDLTIMSGMYGSSGRMLNLAIDTAGTVEWSRGFNMLAGSETCTGYSAGVFPNGMVLIGGMAPNVLGEWEEVSGTVFAEAGTPSTPSFSTNDISTAGTTQSDPAGSESEPLGTQDLGGGKGDAALATFTPSRE